MKHIEKMQHVSDEQSQPVAAHVKLHRLICRRKHLPVLGQLVPVDVGKLADFPHSCRELASEEMVPFLAYTTLHKKGSFVLE